MPVFLATPLSPIIVALAVMLLAWAVTTLLQRPLVFLLSNIPLVGYSISHAVGDAIGSVIDWALSWARSAVSPLVELIAVPIKALSDFILMLATTAETIAQSIITVARVAAGEVGEVAARLASLVAQLASLGSLIASVRAALASLVERVAAILSSAIPAAITAVQAWARALVSSAVAAARAALQGAIDAIRPWAIAAITAALAPIRALLALVPAQIAQAIAVAVHPLAAGLEALGKAMGDAIGAILTRLSVLEKLLPLLALIPLVGIIPRTIDEFWRQKRGCVDPTCDLLGPLLQGLGAAGELLSGSVLLALVAGAINDPEGAAQEVQGWRDELAGLASEVTTVLAGRPV